jgi:hypothetical protein
MQNTNIEQIKEKLAQLPDNKFEVVFDFISYLLEKEQTQHQFITEAYQTMIASEKALARDWHRSEEDEAWANL